jgi:hypothetical protein
MASAATCLRRDFSSGEVCDASRGQSAQIFVAERIGKQCIKQ